MAKKPLTREQLEHFGSLITIKGTDTCLGDLWHADGHGTYDPYHGLVPVSREESKLHNDALSKARWDGMDQNCEIGQGGFAYHHGGQVKDFIGTVVSDDVTAHGNSVTFRRKGKTYRGRLSRNSDAFIFKRVA
jgi:hypothetical protein